ncbi:MAG TPA: glycosyltransferase family 4 protein, partial [Herpetosiphonaceae bacterium]
MTAQQAPPQPGPTVVCTIVAKNYVAAARTLMRSIQELRADLLCVALLVDTPDGYIDAAQEPFALIQADELAIPRWRHFAMKYDIMELSTAVKPFFLAALFERFAARKVIYFDPDILVTGSLDQLLELLDDHQIILTPHILEPLDDDRAPGELDFLRVGTYNLGFLALARSPAADALLAWWQRKLYHDCTCEIERGLFVDQHWMDLAPSLFAGVHVLRDPGYNVAYWNMKTRELRAGAAGYLVNGRPLIFMHFSGFRVDDPGSVSIHQNRFVLGDLSESYQACFADYRRRLIDNGYHATRNWPYAYGAFSDGLAVTPPLRACLRERDRDGERWPDPSELGAASFRAWAAAPEDGALSPYALALHQLHPYLQRAFPDPRGRDHDDYAGWLVAQRGSSDLFADAYIQPIAAALAKRPVPRAAPDRAGLWRRIARTIAYYRAYPTEVAPHLPIDPLAWSPEFYTGPGGLYGRLRGLLRRYGLLKRAKRLIGHRRIMTARFFFSRQPPPGVAPMSAPAGPARSAALPAAPGRSAADGLNLVGYLYSETGVGQAARNVAAALIGAGQPLAALPLTAQDRSRQQARELGDLPQGMPYAISLFHVNADMTFPVREQLGPAAYEGRYNIACWFWELATFPRRWHSCFEPYDEIWAASRFIQQALLAHTDKPVIYMPPPIAVELPEPGSRADVGLPEDACLYLFIFDALSVIERKNPWAVIEAFKQAFPPRERARARLVLKAGNLAHAPAEGARLRAALAEIDGILIDGYLSRREVNALIHHCDAYVSLHRSEGYGLTIAEAMALGKPVIATAYSGNLDLMAPEHSYLVPYRLVELPRDYPPYEAGMLWAEPHIGAAAEHFRAVFSRREEARARGLLAAQF